MPIINVAFLLSLALMAASGQSRGPGHATQLTVADLVSRSSGAVVQIVCSDRDGKAIALGSGFSISADGRIVTNYHVIEGAHSAVATFSNGTSFAAEGVLAIDEEKDLALLKIDGKNLPYLHLSPDSSLHVGDHVVAIGSPLGLEGSASDGIVSAIRHGISPEKWIQTTAPVSHGSSGGPLLTMNGEVVGVITWGVNPEAGQSVNFAIPSEVALTLVSSAGKLIPFDSIKSKTPTSPDTSAGDSDSADRNKTLDEDGLKALSAKQYEGAVHSFREAIQLSPEDAIAWHGLGDAHRALGQYDESTSDFEKAIKYQPKNRDFWYSLGLAYIVVNKRQEALSAFQEVIGIDPSYAMGWYYLGQTYTDPTQVVRCYKQATLLNPDFAEAWFGLGVASASTDDKVIAFKKALAIRPDYPDAWYSLAAAYDAAGQYDEAVASWKKRLECKFDSANSYVTEPGVWDSIGIDYEKLNDLKSAEDSYQKAVALVEAHPYQGDQVLVTLLAEQLYTLYSRMGKHRQADYWQNTWLYLVQHPT